MKSMKKRLASLALLPSRIHRHHVQFLFAIFAMVMLVLGAAKAQRDPLQITQAPLPTKSPGAEPTETPPSPDIQPVPSEIASQPLTTGYALLFEEEGRLLWQPVDTQGLVRGPATRLKMELAGDERVTALYPSPNGREVLVFVDAPGPFGAEGSWRAYVFSPPDGRPQQIFTSEQYGLPFKFLAWHPHTSWVAYWDGTGIWLKDVATGTSKPVARPEAWGDLPYPPQVESMAFSPDGSRMVVSFTLTGSGWELWIAKSDGTEARRLFASDTAIYGLSWSPDGSLIAFVSDNLEVITPDGEGRRIVGHDFIGGLPPAWSPDGRFIAFTAAQSLPKPVGSAGWSGYRVRVVDITSGEEITLPGGARGGEVLPTWSPDGNILVFLSDRTGSPEIWRAAPDGTNMLPITMDGLPKSVIPVWVPSNGQ
jgi:Tol biopolymer transport system component